MQAEMIEKIKKEVLEELIKKNCDIPSEFVVDITIRKTAKSIFENIEKLKQECEKHWKAWGYFEEERDGYIFALNDVLREIKKEWLGGEK